MQCELKSVSDEEGIRNLDNLPPQGFVQQVCQEWLVHEDSALAHRLQKEEIETHYGQNRNVRRVVREDIQHAREYQQEEDKEAVELQMMYEEVLLKQEQEDEEIARQIQEQEKNELELLQHHRDADEVQEKEKEKLGRKKREKGQLKEIRQVEKLRKHCVREPVHLDEEQLQRTSYDADELPTKKLEDLSEFCLQPTPDMDDTAIRRLQEEQDAELARLMQEQETKRSGYSEKDHLMAVEAQDRELAAILQEQERARARRLKEKARKKALLKQQSEQLLTEEIEPYACSTFSDIQSSGSIEELATSSYKRPTSIRPHELPISSLQISGREHKSTLERHLEVQAGGSSKDLYESTTESPVKGHNNVAMAIDPTYLRRQSAAHSNASIEEKPESGNSTPVLPSPMSIRTGAYQGREEEYTDDSDESPAPPYMPIQGQKRTSSLEKKKKGKPGKDGCKQQ